jgi:hypothetical protein
LWGDLVRIRIEGEALKLGTGDTTRLQFLAHDEFVAGSDGRLRIVVGQTGAAARFLPLRNSLPPNPGFGGDLPAKNFS